MLTLFHWLCLFYCTTTTTMASSNKHWTSMFKSKPCVNQWQHDHIIHQKNLGCEERSPDPKPRWNPKPEQIRILDAIFNSGMVNPSRDEIRKIRLQLQEFGPVGDANVFYWFQNRKSRSKNKHNNRNHLSSVAARRTSKPSPTASSSSSSSSSAQSTDSGNKTLPLPTRFQYFAPRMPPATLFPNQMNSLAEPAYQDMGTGIISSDQLYDLETPMQLLMGPDHDDHQECKLKMQYLQHLYAAAATAAAVPTASVTTVGSCVNGSPISDIQELMGELGGGIFDAGATACTRSTVITSEAAYEVTAGRINIRQVFGPEAILVDQSGQPVLTDEWGVTLHPLQHGASYYLKKPFSPRARKSLVFCCSQRGIGESNGRRKIRRGERWIRKLRPSRSELIRSTAERATLRPPQSLRGRSKARKRNSSSSLEEGEEEQTGSQREPDVPPSHRIGTGTTTRTKWWTVSGILPPLKSRPRAKAPTLDTCWNRHVRSSRSVTNLPAVASHCPHPQRSFPLGLSSILSVRGEGRLSLCNNDNFIIDDSEDSSISSEVPFLSIDLHAIDAQLSKLKLSDRLFLEADLFPEEQSVDELTEKKMSEQFENLVAREFKKDFAKSASANLDKTSFLDNYQPQISAGNTTELHSSKEWMSKETQRHNSDSNMITASSPAEITTSKFEVAAAEAELQMLLDSLSKTKLSNAAVDGPGSSRNATTSPIDDAMDSLLATTSSFVQEQNNEASTGKQGSVLISNRASHILGAKLDGGANSLKTGAKLTLDDDIDDLLGETSIFMKNQNPRLPRGLSSASKPVDDLDSWIDTL